MIYIRIRTQCHEMASKKWHFVLTVSVFLTIFNSYNCFVPFAVNITYSLCHFTGLENILCRNFICVERWGRNWDNRDKQGERERKKVCHLSYKCVAAYFFHSALFILSFFFHSIVCCSSNS